MNKHLSPTKFPGADFGDTAAAGYLEGLLEGFVAYDANWRMTYMNAAAERVLGRRIPVHTCDSRRIGDSRSNFYNELSSCRGDFCGDSRVQKRSRRRKSIGTSGTVILLLQ